MTYALTFENTVSKLSDMLAKRFDVELKYVSSESQVAADIVSYETVRRNASAPLIVTYNHMLIPLRVEGSLVGAFKVDDISGLNHVDLSRIKETIDLVMVDGFLARPSGITTELEELESKVLPFRRAEQKLATAN